MISKIYIVLLLFIVSCSSYINNVYHDLDVAQEKRLNTSKKHSNLDRFRSKRSGGRILSSLENPKMPIANKRNYREVKKRYTAKDFKDSSNSASLWSGNKNGTIFLFSDTSKRRPGNIVVINVQDHLLKDIQTELKRATNRISEAIKQKEKEIGKALAKKFDASKLTANEASSDSFFDKVSGVIVEEVRADHVLIQGRKTILFRNEKKRFEIQALISRRDIQQDDSINSSKLLEYSIKVIR